MLRAPLSVLLTVSFQLQSLQSENTSLKRQVTTNIYQIPSGTDYPDPSSPSALKRRQSARASRPMSMYETGSGLKPYLPKGETPYPEEGIPTLQPFPSHVSKTCSLLSFAISLSVSLFPRLFLMSSRRPQTFHFPPLSLCLPLFICCFKDKPTESTMPFIWMLSLPSPPILCSFGAHYTHLYCCLLFTGVVLSC